MTATATELLENKTQRITHDSKKDISHQDILDGEKQRRKEIIMCLARLARYTMCMHARSPFVCTWSRFQNLCPMTKSLDKTILISNASGDLL